MHAMWLTFLVCLGVASSVEAQGLENLLAPSAPSSGTIVEVPQVTLPGSPRPVAMVDLTGRRLEPAQVAQFSSALREQLLMSPHVAMMDSTEMFRRLNGPDGEAQLAQARRLTSAAKKLYREGRLEEAKLNIDSARAIHRSLNSELSRGGELADLFLYEGLILVSRGKNDEALVSFMQMFLLAPDLEAPQVRTLNPNALPVLDKAREQVKAMPLKGLSKTYAGEVARELQVAHLVTGVIEPMERDGRTRIRLTLNLYAPGASESEATLEFELPSASKGLPQGGDPIYEKVAGLTLRYLLAP